MSQAQFHKLPMLTSEKARSAIVVVNNVNGTMSLAHSGMTTIELLGSLSRAGWIIQSEDMEEIPEEE